jgi:hypothetical protein
MARHPARDYAGGEKTIFLEEPTVEIDRAQGNERPAVVTRATLRRFGAHLFGALALVSVAVAVGTVWLVLADPVTVAQAVNQGDLSPFVRDLARGVRDALGALLGVTDGQAEPSATLKEFVAEPFVRGVSWLYAGPLLLVSLGLRAIRGRTPSRACHGDTRRVQSTPHVE